jgi:hypothetical protein
MFQFLLKKEVGGRVWGLTPVIPNFSGCEDEKNLSSRPAWAKRVSMTSLLKAGLSQGMVVYVCNPSQAAGYSKNMSPSLKNN